MTHSFRRAHPLGAHPVRHAHSLRRAVHRAHSLRLGHAVPRAQRGQASVEFVALLLLGCFALSALFALSGRFDGRSVGGFLAHHVVCAVSGRCDADEAALVEAYGARDAAAVRALAPSLVYERGELQLPVDWRECRRAECASAPDDPDLDAHLTRGMRGGRATVFTHLIRRAGRLYIQYWLGQ